MSTPHVAFVGAGMMGLRHAQALLDAGLPREAIVAVYDRELSAARAFAARFGAAPRSSAREALASATHAVVTTSASAHASAAFEALEMRRGLFVEKPLATSIREGAALTSLAKRLALPVHVGHSERFHPVVRALLADLEGRRAERVRIVRRLVAMRARDCSVALNLSVHDVDLALLLTRAPLRVDPRGTSCTASRVEMRLVGEDGASALLEAATGAPADVRTLSVWAGTLRYEADLLAGTLVRHGDAGACAIPAEGPSGLVAQAGTLLAAWTGAPAERLATAHDAFRGLALVARALRESPPSHAETPENLPFSAAFG